MDAPPDGLQVAFEHDAAMPPPPRPQTPYSPTQTYTLETVVPDNWIGDILPNAGSDRLMRRQTVWSERSRRITLWEAIE